MKKHFLPFVLLVGLLWSTGCASTGLLPSSHVTNVQLTNPNFRLLATNVSGEASADALFGVSYGLGLASSQMALIPLSGERSLYRAAMQDLWSSFAATHGAVENRRLALVNVRYDSEALNLFFYTKITTVVVADVVEFE